MRKYETIFVIDSLLKSDEIDSIINKYERFISANGGQIDATERWGKKRLAYEIKKRQYGYYVLIRFDGPPTMIKQLEREYRLNESLLRFKTLAMPKAALKHLAETTPETPADSKATPEPKTADATPKAEATPEAEATPDTEETPTPATEQEQVPGEEGPAEAVQTETEANVEAPVAEEETNAAPETTIETAPEVEVQEDSEAEKK